MVLASEFDGMAGKRTGTGDRLGSFVLFNPQKHIDAQSGERERERKDANEADANVDSVRGRSVERAKREIKLETAYLKFEKVGAFDAANSVLTELDERTGCDYKGKEVLFSGGSCEFLFN